MGRSGATGFERVALESLEQRAVSVDDAGCGEYRLVNAVIGLGDPDRFRERAVSRFQMSFPRLVRFPVFDARPSVKPALHASFMRGGL